MKFGFRKFSEDAFTPKRATKLSAGVDVSSTIDIVIKPKEIARIPLDLCFSFPRGFFGQLCSRSSLAIEHNIHVIAGTIDPDFVFNTEVALINLGTQPFKVNMGDRVAQLICIKTTYAEPTELQNESNKANQGDKERKGGIGSTGRNAL